MEGKTIKQVVKDSDSLALIFTDGTYVYYEARHVFSYDDTYSTLVQEELSTLGQYNMGIIDLETMKRMDAETQATAELIEKDARFKQQCHLLHTAVDIGALTKIEAICRIQVLRENK